MKGKYRLLLILLLFIVIIIGLALFIALKFLSLDITLLGEKEMTIGLKEEYQEAGVKASYLGKDISASVKIEGKVDTQKEGTYTLTYRIKKNGIEKTVEIKITVKDLEPPTITLDGEKEITICNIDSYQEAGYHANDNKDGDITDKVKITKEENKIVYEVSDHNGNTVTETRSLKIDDNKAPVITLSGGEVLSLVIGNAYHELGYKASDNCMGDITKKVKVPKK